MSRVGRNQSKEQAELSDQLKALHFRLRRSWELDSDLQAKLSLASEGTSRGGGFLAVWISRLVLQRKKEGRGPRRPAPTRRPACGPRAALSWRGEGLVSSAADVSWPGLPCSRLPTFFAPGT